MRMLGPATIGFVFGARRKGIGEELAITRKLIRDQHEESMRYHARRDEESRRRDEEGEARTEELRAFMREILSRNEKVYTAMVAEMEEGRKQIAANTKAVLSMLDRMNGSAPPA